MSVSLSLSLATVEQDSVEVGKNIPQERISERSEGIEVPKISCQECVEVVKNVPQEQISERSKAIEVPKISSQEWKSLW